MAPAMTMPVTLAGAEIGRRSSISPTAKMTAAASSTPSGSELFRNRVENRSICQAAPIAAPSPRNIATPPMAGVGCACTRRSSGGTTHPKWRATRRTTGVVTIVTKAAMKPTNA
jgi:hypothetical protein